MSVKIEKGHNRFLRLRNINNSGNEFLDLEILITYSDVKNIEELVKWHNLHNDRTYMVDFSYLLNMKHRKITSVDHLVIMG